MSELHERIFETTTDAMFVADVETGEIVAANPAAADLVGRDREAIVGSRFAEFHAANERDRYKQLFREFVEQERGRRDDLHVRTDDGEQVHVEISGSVIEVDGRRLMQGTFRDITHRKELEAELRAERERYRRIFASSNDAIFVVDPEADEILDCNERACEMLGYEAGELVGEPISTVHPDEMERFHEFAADVFEAGEGWTEELTCLTSTGERLPSIVAASTIQWDDDPAMLACVQDISEQKRRETALEGLQHTAQQLLESRSREDSAELAADAVADVLDTPYGTVWFRAADGEFRPVASTEAAAEDGLPAVADVDAFLTDAAAQVEDGIVEMVPATGFDGPLGCVLLTPLGEHGMLSVGLAEEEPSTADRRFVEILAANVAAALDRADREAELEHRNEQLAILNRIVRHDIRNDATLLITELQQARDAVTGGDHDAIIDHVDRALDDTDHVVGLTDTVGDLVDVVTEGSEPDSEPVDLAGLLHTQVDRAGSAHADATFDLTVDGEARVAANDMLSSVFRNLLHNAVDHHDGESPRVEVEARVEGEHAVVRVADDGPGIPDERKAEIFGRGEQGLKSTGVGLGLYLVDRLIDRFGGEVYVEDSDLGGAAFVVELPLADR